MGIGVLASYVSIVPLFAHAYTQVVGASNTISGLMGGYTGSYIFSQTIFIMRAGVESRLTVILSTVLEVHSKLQFIIVECALNLNKVEGFVFFIRARKGEKGKKVHACLKQLELADILGIGE